MLVRGRLAEPSTAPSRGERFAELAASGPTTVEQILSSASDQPVRYQQDHDEWVVVLAGGAVLDVDGEACDLGPGDWVVLPAGVPHTVVRTEPGTSWLAVHLHPGV